MINEDENKGKYGHKSTHYIIKTIILHPQCIQYHPWCIKWHQHTEQHTYIEHQSIFSNTFRVFRLCWHDFLTIHIQNYQLITVSNDNFSFICHILHLLFFICQNSTVYLALTASSLHCTMFPFRKSKVSAQTSHLQYSDFFSYFGQTYWK